MEVQVLFTERDYLTGDIEGYDHVATVVAPELADTSGALEFAFRRLQNLDGSWSMGENIDFCDNPDYHTSVTVLKPLGKDYRGKTMGHRCCCVMDRMIIDGTIYEVDSFGFKKVA